MDLCTIRRIGPGLAECDWTQREEFNPDRGSKAPLLCPGESADTADADDAKRAADFAESSDSCALADVTPETRS